MSVVDSSGWLAMYLDDGTGTPFDQPLTDRRSLIVPSICIYEVHRVVASRVGDQLAFRIALDMRNALVVDLDFAIATQASMLSRRHGLALADAVIYSTARDHDAELWTQDAHFDGLPGVRFFPKTKRV